MDINKHWLICFNCSYFCSTNQCENVLRINNSEHVSTLSHIELDYWHNRTSLLYENIDQILPEYIIWTNALKNRWYMCIQWTRVLNSIWQHDPHVSQFNSLCNEFTSVWSMFAYNNRTMQDYNIAFTYRRVKVEVFKVVLNKDTDKTLS